MLKEMIDTGNALKEAGQTNNFNERVMYTANTGIALISTANSNINGTGTIVNIITGASNGTLVKTITIQSITNVTKGMVRLFIFDRTNYYFLDEINVPAAFKSGTVPAFSITFDLDYDLKAGYSIAASTQNAESFNIIAEGLDFKY
jgi:hypothetical protein